MNMESMHRARLFLSTARHLRAEQIFCRGRRYLRHAWWKVIDKQVPSISATDLNPPRILHWDAAVLAGSGPWKEHVTASAENAERLLSKRFCFLKYTVPFDAGIRWQDSSLSQLWLYHLHYFDYLQDLLVYSVCRDSEAAYQTFRSIASSWIDYNDRIRGNGWHPYTISIRMINWLQALSGFADRLAADPSFDVRFRASLSAQAYILAHDLETDVRGNHLIANLRGLIFWELASPGGTASQSLGTLMQRLQRELAEQVLRDGGHFERSPGYHCQVLKHCLEIALCLRQQKESVPDWLEDAVRRMLGYLIDIAPVDGALPLLKDTTWEGTSFFDLLAAGAVYFNDPQFKRSESFGLYPLLLFGSEGWNRFAGYPLNTDLVPSRELPDSRYYIMRDDSLRDHLIFDAGKPCPDYLPAHAHADLLSFELRVSGERIFVDSGVHGYAAGKWRDYFRSTRAHNTVELDGANQSEVWSSFRVARRARPGKVFWLETPEYLVVQGSHDGYMRLATQAIHRRTLYWKPGQFWLILDEIHGTAPAKTVSYLHLHPKLGLEEIQDGLWHIEGTAVELFVSTFGASSNQLQRGAMTPQPQGWYSEFFGEREPNTVLSMQPNADLPVCFGYLISKGSAGQAILQREAGQVQVRIDYAGRESLLSLSQNGTPECK